MKHRLALATIVAILVALTLDIVEARAAAPQPMLSPAEVMLPEQIRPGMTGYGKSVFNGTKVDTFGVTVLGVMRHTDFNGDLILVRITSGPVVKNRWGVIAGMSGSPIYIKGKLIGALAFAWSYAKEPIAGVTPIRQMAENFSPNEVFPLPKPIAVGRPRSASSPTTLVPRHGSVRIGSRVISRAQIYSGGSAPRHTDAHTMALTPIATPVMVSGFSPRSMKLLTALFEPYGLVPMAGGGKAPTALAGKPTPGSAIGIQLVGGDVDMTVVGTVTYVKGNRVLAMGHPFEGLGSVDLPMVNTYVSSIIPSMELSVKMASAGSTVIGRWTEDRPWSCGGVLGEKPRTFPATFSLRDATRDLDKTYRTWVSRSRQLTPALVASAASAAIESIAPLGEGTLTTRMEVSAKGLPAIRRTNTYSASDSGDMGLLAVLLGSGGASSPDAELLQIMDTLENNAYGPVAPERVSLTAEWESARRVATIRNARARVRRVRPGDVINIEVEIQPWNKPLEMRSVAVAVPANAPAGRLQVGIAGGASADTMRSRMMIAEPTPTTLAQELDRIVRQNANNELLIETAVDSSGIESRGRQLADLPSAVSEVITAANTTGFRVIRDHVAQRVTLPYVLTGGELLSFIVDSDEKDKAGRGPSISASQLELGLSPAILRGLLEPGSPGSGESSSRPTTVGAGDPAGEESEPDSDKIPPKPGDDSLDDGTGPEVPSFEELDVLEQQEPESLTAETATDAPKGQSVMRLPLVWRDDTEQDFAKGKTFGTSINTSGRVGLAPSARPLYDASEGMVWAEAGDGAGGVYIASWLDAAVTRIGADGAPSRLFATSDLAIQALATDGSGALYAAATSGAIYKASGPGKPAVLCTLPADHIWALLPGNDGGLLAATGPEGKLFRVSPTGTFEIAFQAPDRHIIALAAAPGGAVYLATYPKGKVYRLADGKTEPFYETIPSVTALSLAVDAKGQVYVGTSPSGQIVRLDARSKARLLYKSAERHIFAMWPAPDGSLYAATGPRARIYRILPDGTAEVAWDGKNGNVVSLVESGGRLYASLAGGRQVVALDLGARDEGSFVSSVLDATGPARWGQVRWSAVTPEGSSISLQTRSGNTAYPDATWTDWSAPCTNAAGEPVTSPSARYLQYRATLKPGTSAAPSLHHVEVFYLTMNRPPEVKLLDPGKTYIWSGKKSIRWSASDPDKGDVLTYQTYYSGDRGATWTEIKESAPKPEAKPEPPSSEAPDAKKDGAKPESTPGPKQAPDKARTPEQASDSAEDDDENVTTVVVTAQKPIDPETPGAEKPTAAKEAEKAPPPTRSTSLSWDTTKVPDGTYLIKVVASDGRSNPTEPLSDEQVSESITVDNTAPVIALEKTQEPQAPPASIKLTDVTSYVASVEYRIDGGDWIGAACADGIYDGQLEEALIAADALPAGEHTFEIRARDGAGNEAKAEVKYRK